MVTLKLKQPNNLYIHTLKQRKISLHQKNHMYAFTCKTNVLMFKLFFSLSKRDHSTYPSKMCTFSLRPLFFSERSHLYNESVDVTLWHPDKAILKQHLTSALSFLLFFKIWKTMSDDVTVEKQKFHLALFTDNERGEYCYVRVNPLRTLWRLKGFWKAGWVLMWKTE